jgi:hypothetical protein
MINFTLKKYKNYPTFITWQLFLFYKQYMHDYKRKISIAFSLCLVTSVLFAQTHKPDSYKLVAAKGNFQKVYTIGTKFFLKFYSDSSIQKCRGVFTGLTNDEIIITAHKKGKAFLILPDNILLLRKIKPGSRIIYAAIGTALVAGGSAVINNENNTPGAAMRDALIIPVIGAGVYFLCAIPVSLFLEKIGEKKKAMGWVFKIESY